MHVCKQELNVAETCGASFNQHNIQIILSLYRQRYFMYIKILNKTALLPSEQAHVYCKLCIAVCFNEILM